MSHVDVSDFERASAKLKAAPAKLRRSLNKRLNEAARPAIEKVLQQGSEDMPRRGGLAARLAARGNARISRTNSGIAAILGRRGAYLAGPNSGLLRHPVWGRARWVAQPVPAGTYDEAFEAQAEEVEAVVSKTFDDVVRDL